MPDLARVLPNVDPYFAARRPRLGPITAAWFLLAGEKLRTWSELELRRIAREEAAAAARREVGIRYAMAFARQHDRCTACGREIDAGSYRPKLIAADAEAWLCLPCCHEIGTPELRRLADATLTTKRAS